jgi:putative lipoprotein
MPARPKALRLLALAALALAACTSQPETTTDGADTVMESTESYAVSAELSYRERIALPPNAVALAELRIAGSPEVIAASRQPLEGAGVPVAVTLNVERARVPADAGVAFHGGIEVDGVRRWSSEAQPVALTGAAVDVGVVMLFAVESPTPESLQGGTWVVEDIAGGGVIDDSRVTLVFEADGVGGQASCNSYRARWTLEDGRLSIADPAVTMMACPEALMNQERRFLEALASADSVSFDETGALILAGNGAALLRARREV